MQIRISPPTGPNVCPPEGVKSRSFKELGWRAGCGEPYLQFFLNEKDEDDQAMQDRQTGPGPQGYDGQYCDQPRPIPIPTEENIYCSD
eukprot:2177863-Karenia_brevis.AAC.1